MNYDGASEITLTTSRMAIVIVGKNLEDLFDHIIQHQVKWLKEPEASFSKVAEDEVEISSIRFEMLQ